MTKPRLAVISGAAQGIGAALARKAAIDKGLHVALIDINKELVTKTVQEIIDAGGSASAHVLDITDAAAVDGLAQQLTDDHGSPAIVMCNAGIEYAGYLWEMTPAAWERVQSINVNGAFNIARAFLGSMIESNAPGQLLFTSSVGGIGVGHSQGAYTVSKHSIRVLAQCFAADLEEIGSGIKVSILLPAAVKTQIFETSETSNTQHSEEYRQKLAEHLANEGQTPEQVAETVFAAFAEGKRWIHTHPDRSKFYVDQLTQELNSGLS